MYAFPLATLALGMHPRMSLTPVLNSLHVQANLHGYLTYIHTACSNRFHVPGPCVWITDKLQSRNLVLSRCQHEAILLPSCWPAASTYYMPVYMIYTFVFAKTPAIYSSAPASLPT